MTGNIEQNLKHIHARIADAQRLSGRISPVDILCVSKNRSEAETLRAVTAGLELLGENRVQEASVKIDKLGRICKWHMIGHLQTNKARTAVGLFDVIQSVDSIYLLNEINHHASRAGKIQEVYVELKVSEEESKFGLTEDRIYDFFSEASRRNSELANVCVTGLMTMAPLSDNAADARPYFARAAAVFQKLSVEYVSPLFDLKHLSMGMSFDYAEAVMEGANMVRIGTGLFE